MLININKFDYILTIKNLNIHNHSTLPNFFIHLEIFVILSFHEHLLHFSLLENLRIYNDNINLLINIPLITSNMAECIP